MIFVLNTSLRSHKAARYNASTGSKDRAITQVGSTTIEFPPGLSTHDEADLDSIGYGHANPDLDPIERNGDLDVVNPPGMAEPHAVALIKGCSRASLLAWRAIEKRPNVLKAIAARLSAPKLAPAQDVQLDG